MSLPTNGKQPAEEARVITPFDWSEAPRGLFHAGV